MEKEEKATPSEEIGGEEEKRRSAKRKDDDDRVVVISAHSPEYKEMARKLYEEADRLTQSGLELFQMTLR